MNRRVALTLFPIASDTPRVIVARLSVTVALLMLLSVTVLSGRPATAEPPSNGQQSSQADQPDQGKSADQTESSVANSDAGEKTKDAAKQSKDGAEQWVPMTGHWEPCHFGGDGLVEIKDGRIKLGFGDPITGVRWTGDLLRENYELRMQAQRVEGIDFFCAVTFPVGDERCSLVLGGWGGGVLGISSIDGRDASENPTTQFKMFDNETWYRIRIRVDPKKIVCWVNDKVWVDQPRAGHEFDIRYEMEPALPLGIANYHCISKIRNIARRQLHVAADPAAEPIDEPAATEPTPTAADGAAGDS